MKKLAYLFLLLFTFSITLNSCRDTNESEAEEAVEEVADDVEDAVD